MFEQLKKDNCLQLLHCHTNDETIYRFVTRKLYIIISICCVFMLFELVGGYLANSLAIMSDALHLFSDLIGFIISLLSALFARKCSTKKMNFGYARAEVLGALLSIVFIWIVTLFLLILSIYRLLNSYYEIDARIMLCMSIIGFFINSLMAIILNASCLSSEDIKSKFNAHSHANHNNASILIIENESKIKINEINLKIRKNLNIRAAFIHILGDMLQSLGVIIASIIIIYYPSLKFIDPACTILFSLLVLITTHHITKDVISILFESFPLKYFDYDKLNDLFYSVNYVKHVHSLNVWCLTIDKYCLNVHLAIDYENLNQMPQVLNECHQKLRLLNTFIEFTNIQIEIYDERMLKCEKCKAY
jgi:solute carrier family 30 (zinc transporter), member 2